MMKFRILFIVLITTSCVIAQKDFIVRGGINMNNQLDGMFGTEDLQPGILVSAGLLNDFGKNFGSGLELSYIEKAAKHEIDSVEVNDLNQYIELGVSVKLRKDWEKTSIYLTGGMLLSFWQAARRTYDYPDQKVDDYLKFPEARGALDVGMYLGAGARYRNVILELRTHQGLMDISNENYDETSIFNQGISLSIAYAFSLDD